jgi:TMEM175 potassium channel family protein
MLPPRWAASWGVVDPGRTGTPVNKERLTAFSDGVIAIIITIMVLDLKVPANTDWPALIGTLPLFLSYLLSFVYVAIYWNNHHHMLHTVRRVNGLILWTNTHLLFWLSLTPWATAWLGQNYRAALPTAVYGGLQLLTGFAYYILQRSIVRTEGHESTLAVAVGSDRKGKASLLLYAAAIGLTLVEPALSDVVYVGVALMWFVPDRRIERRVDRGQGGG